MLAPLCSLLLALPLGDDFALKLHPDKVFEAIPGSMLMNVEHMKQERPAHLTREPHYTNPPWYAALTLGEGKEPLAFALDEDDGRALLYIDLNRNGDLTDDAPADHRREIIPEEKRTPQLKVWIFDHFDAKVPVRYADGGEEALAITFRTYGKVCRDLYNHMPPDIVYWSTYYRSGAARFGEAEYTIAVKDQNADGRFDTLKDDTHLRGDTAYIDTNRNGIFEPRTEGFTLDKPFAVDGQAWEIARITPRGDRIAFERSTREVIPTSLRAGELAPDFDIPGLGKLSSLRGKVVLVDFWATWCIPCLAEMPNVVETHNRFKDKGFRVVGISIDKEGDAEKMHQVARNKGMEWPEVHDHAQAIAKKYFVTAIPATFLIGPDGRVIATHLRGEDLAQAVAEAVAALPPRGG